MLARAGIDLYHGDSVPNDAFALAKQAGVRFVLHKATHGITRRDPLWRMRLADAKRVGLYTGIYHFLTRAPGDDQAKFFLDETQPRPGDVLMLDHEEYKSSQGTLGDARDFLRQVTLEMGSAPLYYSFSAFLFDLLCDDQGHEVRDDVLASSQLAIAEYRSLSPKWPSLTWPSWTLWQNWGTECMDGPRVPGFPGTVDQYAFNGVEEDLDALFQGKNYCPAPPVGSAAA